MKRLILTFLMAVISLSAFSYVSGIAILTEKNSSMQVYVNGKLCNSGAKTFVRVRSNPGIYNIELKVLNPHDKMWYVVRKQVRIDKGYEFYYRVIFESGKRPSLEFVKRYPSFHNFYNPASLYKHTVS